MKINRRKKKVSMTVCVNKQIIIKKQSLLMDILVFVMIHL